MKRAVDSSASTSCKKARLQCFRDAYSKEWPFYGPSKVSNNHVFCKTCGCDFSIAHGGRDDCRRHSLSKKHQDYEKLKCQPLEKIFAKKDDDSTHAELLFTSFLVEHNLPLAVADHAKNLFKTMFPDSKIAQKFSCARTKTSALVKCLANSAKEKILTVVQSQAFALATDGSNDSNDKKLYPVVVTYFDAEKGRISTVLLSLLETSDNTGKGIFTAIDEDFRNLEVAWKNCVSFSCDNANTMIGNVKGVTAFIKEVQPAIIVVKCACHSIHIAAKKGTSKLSCDVEQLIVQIFFYLEKSSKRKRGLKISQDLCNAKPHKILKYVSTRWLSLLESIERILEQWDALEHFFSGLDCRKENTSQLQNIQLLMSNPLTKLYCLFLSSALPVFTAVNKVLQQEAPLIHKLKRKLSDLLFQLITRFVKPSAVTDISSILGIQFQNRKHQKDDCDLVIGAKSRAYIKDQPQLSETDILVFYSSVRDFYVAACSYIVKKFPLNDEFLCHAEVADVELRKKGSFSSIQYLNTLYGYGTENLDKLELEFSLYQNDTFDFNDFSRMDECWHKISFLKNEQGLPKYATLAKLMLTILIVPHSNAATERIFSIVRKNMTMFRPNLSTHTLSSLLIEKVKNLSDGAVCFEKKFSKAEIDAAKKATKLNVTS